MIFASRNPKKNYSRRRKNMPYSTIVHGGAALNPSRIEASQRLGEELKRRGLR